MSKIEAYQPNVNQRIELYIKVYERALLDPEHLLVAGSLFGKMSMSEQAEACGVLHDRFMATRQPLKQASRADIRSNARRTALYYFSEYVLARHTPWETRCYYARRSIQIAMSGRTV